MLYSGYDKGCPGREAHGDALWETSARGRTVHGRKDGQKGDDHAVIDEMKKMFSLLAALSMVLSPAPEGAAEEEPGGKQPPREITVRPQGALHDMDFKENSL